MASSRHALLVATSRFTDGSLRRLRAPGRDAAALGDVLADPDRGNFTMSMVVDQDGHTIRIAISDFLSSRQADDFAVVYLSSHGIRDARGRLYFAATDTLKSHLAATGIEARWLTERLDECVARQQVLILDCCFSGAFAHHTKGISDHEIADVLPRGRGRQVLTASRAGEYSFEGTPLDGGEPVGSVFTTGLVEGIRTGAADVIGRGYVTVTDAYDYAFEYVSRHGAAQTPQLFVERVEGRLILARNPSVPAPASSRVGESEAAHAMPRAAHPAPARHRTPHLVDVIGVGAPSTIGNDRLIALSAGGDRLAVTGPLRIDEFVTGAGRNSYAMDGTVQALAYDGDEIVSLTRGPNGLSSSKAGAITARGDARLFALSATTLVIANGTAEITIVSVVDSHQTIVSAGPELRDVAVLAIGDDGRYAAVAGASGHAVVLDLTERTTIPWDIPAGRVAAMALSPDGSIIVAGSLRGAVHVWDRDSGDVRSFRAGTSVHSVAVSPDGSQVVVATGDGSVSWWDGSSKSLVECASLALRSVVAFSTDGRHFASAGADGKARRWEVRA